MIVEACIRYLVQKVSDAIDTFSLEPRQIASHDRSILEQVILPYFAQDIAFQKILFVGCSAYTQRYSEFFSDKEYWTIDSKYVKRKYGAEHHIVDSITNVGRHVAKNYFDVILMNGVIGFGLNRVGDIEQAIDACYQVLASQGVLLVGWNDTPRRTPLDIRTLPAIRQLREYHFAPLQTCHYQTQGSYHHMFSFYQKA